MISECRIRCYATGLAHFAIGFSLPYVLLSVYVKKTNPRAFRYLLVIPSIVALHSLTYLSKNLQKCEREEMQAKLKEV